MEHISLGDLDVSRIGLGAMGMSAFYAGAGSDDAESIRTIHRALDLGVTLIDTAELYGPFTNEELVGRAIAGRRDEVVLATRFGNYSHRTGTAYEKDSSPENVRLAIEGSLRRLGTDHIDLYYQHRVDTAHPIEDTMGALANLVQEGRSLRCCESRGALAASFRAPFRWAETGPGANRRVSREAFLSRCASARRAVVGAREMLTSEAWTRRSGARACSRWSP